MSRLWALVFLLVCALLLSHCGTGSVVDPGEEVLTEPGKEMTSVDAIGATSACTLGTIGYPVMDRRAYTRTYRGRSFYADGNHLGLDLSYPEGTAVYPIGPGIIRVYRPATGYGTLVVVIEHCARLRFEATNGLGRVIQGQRFLTIYGHLRRTTGYNSGRSLSWSVGDVVTPYDIVGYIQRDSDNGDGAEHVHLGVRLQGMQEAIRSDPSAWFRGYDSRASQRQWFADPARFYRELADQITLLDEGDAYVETPFPAPTAARDAGPPVPDVPMIPDASVPMRDAGPPPSPPPSVDASPPPTPIDVPSPPRPPPPPPPPSVDAGPPPVDVPLVRDVGPPDRGPRESCNGSDDDGDGLIDEDFLCVLGRQVELCSTHCGSIGYIRCELPTCQPGTTCHLFLERCLGGADDDCDGLRDCADPDCASDPSCVVRDAGPSSPPPPLDAGALPVDVFVPPPPPPPDAPRPSADTGSMSSAVIRYEFRVLESSGWGAIAPFRLRDRWWTMMRCENTGTTFMEPREEGWYRCDLRGRLSPFVGSFYSPLHSDWGDRGNLGTVGNSPERCTPTEGVEWRITDLVTGTSIFRGTSAELPCVGEGSQDRHRLP